MKRLLFGLTALCTLALTALPASADPVRFATQGIGTSMYVYASSMAQAAQPLLPADARIDISTTGGGTGAPFLIMAGKADMALSNGAPTRWAMDGTFPGKPKAKGVNALVGGFDAPFLVIIFSEDFIKKSGISTMEELVAKKYPVRVAAKTVGGLGEAACRQAFEALGASYDDIRKWGGKVILTSPMEIVSQLRDGQADVTIDHLPAGQAAITELTMTANVRFVQPGDGMIKKLQEMGWDTVIMPKGTWKNQDEDVKTLSTGVCLLASEKMPEEVAYQITKGICENKDALVAAYASMAPFDPATAWEPAKLGAPIHPGAARYYREKGYMK